MEDKTEVTLNDLMNVGTLNNEMYDLLLQYIEDGKNIIVFGNTNSGRTTVLRCLNKLKNNKAGYFKEVYAINFIYSKNSASPGDIVIEMAEYSDGSRRMKTISEVIGIEKIRNIFKYDYKSNSFIKTNNIISKRNFVKKSEQEILHVIEKKEDEIKYNLIKDLVEYRRVKGLSQQEVADKSGLTQQMISRIEKLDFIPQLDTFIKCITALDLDIKLVDRNNKLNNLDAELLADMVFAYINKDDEMPHDFEIVTINKACNFLLENYKGNKYSKQFFENAKK